MRVALFGGSFDPPHAGHVALASTAADAFGLDLVLVAPVGKQPLKLAVQPESYLDRMAMVTLACANDPRLVASDLDRPRTDGTPNYTVNTLEEMRRKFPEAELFALIGADAYLGMSHWREPARLFALAQWIVATRPGFVLAPLEVALEGRVHWLETVHVDISATDIRERLREGLDCEGLIQSAVLEYIEGHGLYGRRKA